MRDQVRTTLLILLVAALATAPVGCWGKKREMPGDEQQQSGSGELNTTFDLRVTLGSATTDTADVFLLFDDTGSFAGEAPSIIALFPELVNALLGDFPDVDFAFGVGRFEDFGGGWVNGSDENTTGRPFILSQPILEAADPDFDTLLSGGLGRTAPGYGGDSPETLLEALWQVATGAGFDGDGNGSMLDSGAAGDPLTQTEPGDSGDVPPFSSNVLKTSGTLGGVGWRAGAFHVLLAATDVCSVSAFPAPDIPATVTGVGGTVTSAAFACTDTVPGVDRFGFIGDTVDFDTNTVGGAVVPLGGGNVQGTIDALNGLGIQVIGLGPGSTPVLPGDLGASFSPDVVLSALAFLTGAVDAGGVPLVFSIGTSAEDLAQAVGDAIAAAITQSVDIAVDDSAAPGTVTVSSTPNVQVSVGPGESATFSITVTGTLAAPLTLTFRDQNSNSILGTAVLTFDGAGNPSLVAGTSGNVSLP